MEPVETSWVFHPKIYEEINEASKMRNLQVAFWSVFIFLLSVQLMEKNPAPLGVGIIFMLLYIPAIWPDFWTTKRSALVMRLMMF